MRRAHDVRRPSCGTPRAARLAARGSGAVLVALAASLGVAGAGASAAAGGSTRSLISGVLRGPALGPAGFGAHAAPVPARAPRALASSVPSPGQSSELGGVACIKASDCWAVGYYTTSSATLNEALHWNGKKWSAAKIPDPAGKASGDYQELSGVACTKASDCWAVGEWENSQGAHVNETLHWNGEGWSQVRTRDPASNSNGDQNELYGVACTKASDCWAVGDSQSGSRAAELDQALHWNGKKWSVAKTPEPAGKASGDQSILYGVTCASAGDCWAVGSMYSGTATLNEALHWNGKKWSVTKTPDPAGKASGDQSVLSGVTCASAGDCWAVGFMYGGTADLNEALRFNGKKWSHVTTPQPATTPSELGNPLSSVDCISASDCWAVGNYYNGTSLFNEAMHWNGKKWSHVPTPQPAGTTGGYNVLSGVSCPSASDCRAVGWIYKTSNSNEALHWTGKKWSKE